MANTDKNTDCTNEVFRQALDECWMKAQKLMTRRSDKGKAICVRDFDQYGGKGDDYAVPSLPSFSCIGRCRSWDSSDQEHLEPEEWIC